MSASRLSTEETAARLGVKKETVYAYVSRGVLSRQRAVDGKASTFDAAEVDRLRRKRLGGRPGRLDARVTTAIADVRDGVVTYRGTSLHDLAKQGTSYEGAADLLWEVPPSRTWLAPEPLIRSVSKAMSLLPPTATLIDQLLAGVVIASAHDPFRDQRARESAASSMRTLVAAIVGSLPTVGSSNESEITVAERLWPRLSSAGSDDAATLDRALMLLADHGMASSTLAARLAASTRAGPHAAIIAGLGALNGPLHGAASRSVHLLLEHAQHDGAEAAIARALRSDGRLPGIGHFIHKTADPRFDLLMQSIEASSLAPDRLAIVDEVLTLTSERISAPHNIDFAIGSLTFSADMKPDAGELIFAIARIVGWVAHTLEEYEEAPLRFRPVGRYNPSRPRPAPDPI